MAALIAQPGTARQVRLTQGLQPHQYLQLLAAEGILQEQARAATGQRRRELSQHLSWLVHRVRIGQLDGDAKERAAALGLTLTVVR